MTVETPVMPDWFNPSRHAQAAEGIVRLADRALLADDGLPASQALRAAEARAKAPAAKTARTVKGAADADQ